MAGKVIAEVVLGTAVLFDVYCTWRVMRKNPEGELNPLVHTFKNLYAGIAVGVLAPSAALGLVGWFVPPVLYLLTGARACYGYLQYLSLKRGLI